eukprot:CAMPEP_0197440998 /NCGR_PEP_ID=MMETSP1175-20131217/7373_1 /TAXON_ID=1003142 /ORGANISM="Triceratium dubium, Strain CCMP147" /LENGTH=32 /DNA_ID= /DNA_START= /DNA_END= /DNA_ORIENTATION=
MAEQKGKGPATCRAFDTSLITMTNALLHLTLS